MNDDPKLTEQQLRQITSRASSAQPQLDPEAAMARETFLAVGAALESAAADYDEAALLATLSREQTCSQSSLAQNWWPLILCGALAASALLAVVRIAMLSPQSDRPIVERNEPGRPSVIARQLPVHPYVGWNESIDDEIALAAATIEQIGSRGRGFDSSIYEMNVQLQELSQELLRESL